MTRSLAALALAFAAPASADVTPELCKQAVGAAARPLAMMLPAMADWTTEHAVTEDGWCVSWSPEAGPSATVYWQVADLSAIVAGNQPFKSLTFRTDQFDNGEAAGVLRQISGSILHDPETRRLTAKDVVLTEGDRWEVIAQGELSGIDLSSEMTVQMSLGAMRLHGLDLVERTLTPQSDRALDGAADLLIRLIDLRPDAFAPEHREALAGYLAASGLLAGRLNLGYDSQGGLGMLSLLAGFEGIDAGNPAGLDIYLDGATLTIGWEPLP